MEMASFAISDLPRFGRRRVLLHDVNGSFGRSSLSRYGSSDLASPDQSWIVSHGCPDLASPDQSWIISHGCHDEVYPRVIYPD